MSEKEIEAELLARLHKEGEVQLVFHHERPPGDYFVGAVYFLKNSIACFLVSQLPVTEVVCDVYVIKL